MLMTIPFNFLVYKSFRSCIKAGKWVTDARWVPHVLKKALRIIIYDGQIMDICLKT